MGFKKIIDFHTHNIMLDYIAALKKYDALLDEDFPIPSWNLESHLNLMESLGLGISVLTMPAPQPYFGDAQAALAAI